MYTELAKPRLCLHRRGPYGHYKNRTYTEHRSFRKLVNGVRQILCGVSRSQL